MRFSRVKDLVRKSSRVSGPSYSAFSTYLRKSNMADFSKRPEVTVDTMVRRFLEEADRF